MNYKILQYLLLNILLLFFGFNSYSQLQGTYTVNAAVATGGTNFQSFTALANALNTQTVINPVTVNVVANSGPYNEVFHVNTITGVSTINRVTINGNNNIIEFNNSNTARSIVALNGSNYVSIKNLTVKSLNNTYGWGFHLYGNAQHDSIINCKVNLESVNIAEDNAAAGLVISASQSGYNNASAYGNNASNIYFGDSEIFGNTTSQSGYFTGISLNGMYNNGYLEGLSNIVIKNNIIKNFYRNGIQTRYANKINIHNNNIHRIDKPNAPTTNFMGIYLGECDQSTVNGNRVHNPNSAGTSASFGFVGIHLFNFQTDNDPNNNTSIVSNNAIYGNSSFGGASQYIKITSNNLNTCKVLNNTIDISNVIVNGVHEMSGIELGENATDVYVQNNIVHITEGNTGKKVGLKIIESFDINKLKNNNIYVNSNQVGQQFYSQYSNNNLFSYPTFAAAQAVNMHVGDMSVDPQFTNAATGNFLPLNNQMFQAGAQTLGLVPKDILGNNRNILPTIGAWEMSNNLSIDGGAVAMVSPHDICVANQNLTVRVGNFTANPINTVTVKTYINNVVQPNYIYATVIPANGFADITTMTYNFLPNQKYTIKFELVDINNGTDGNLLNNTYETTFMLGLSGSYTLNQAIPTSGTNYQSFSNLADDLNKFGVCGAVVVDVDPLLNITDKFYLDSIKGVSAINTVRINGNQGKLLYNAINEYPAAILFDNTQFVTINNLDIKCLGDSAAMGIMLCNGSAYDSLINNKITIHSDYTYYYNAYFGRSGGVAIHMDRFNTYYNNNNHNSKSINDIYIGNNSISGPNEDSINYQFGIISYGNYYNNFAYNQLSNINIIGNNIKNFGTYGIHTYYSSNSNISYNNIEKPARDSLHNYYYYTMAIYAAVNNNLNIIGNKIHNIEVDSNINTGNGFYGIYAANQNTYQIGNFSSIIANNAIYDIRYRIWQNNYNHHNSFINLVSVNNVKVLHNTIDIDSIESTQNYYNAAIAMNVAAQDVSSEIKNNLIRINKVVGQQPYYAFKIINNTNTLLNGQMQKNNVYMNPTSPAPIIWGNVGGTPYPNLAAFQAAYPLNEIGSTEIEPIYYDFANNDLTPTNPILLNTGVNLQAIVPLDIEKYNRPTNPTIGAFEMNPADYNNAGVLALNSPLGNFCSGYRSIQCKINNAGKNNITVVTINWSVNNVMQPPVVYNGTMFGSSSGNPNNSANVTLGTAFIPFGFPSQIKIWTSQPNNAQDLYNANDTLITFVEPTNTIAVNLFGNDTTICEGYNYSLVAGNPTQLQYTYLWDNSSTAPSRPINNPGIYWVIKTDNNSNCSAHDSIEIKFNPTPVVNLGPDQGICIGDSIILSVGNQNEIHAKLWNDNDTVSNKTVYQPGTYYVEVTNSFGCMGSDEIVIEDKEVPEIDGINAVYMLNAVYNFSLKSPKYVLMAIWDFGDGSPVDTGFLVTHKYQKNGYYNVTVKLLSTCDNGGYITHTETLDAIGLGTDEINKDLVVQLYPIPASEAVTIKVSNDILINSLGIYNAIGQQVISKKSINKNSINISTLNLASGIYIAEIHTNKGLQRIKFEIVK